MRTVFSNSNLFALLSTLIYKENVTVIYKTSIQIESVATPRGHCRDEILYIANKIDSHLQYHKQTLNNRL